MLAPMHGVGAAGVRDLIAELGRPGMICAPFLRITDQRPNIPWLLESLHRTNGVPLSVQLLGRHPANLALATRVLVDAGVDVVDLNLGCPTHQALKKGVGAALLSELGTLSRIVTAMRAACPGRLSVKIRTADGPFEEVLAIAKAIQEAGADFLVVHPRNHRQGYRGVAGWDLVKRLRAHVNIPLVGNGDLWYATDALRLMRSTGVAAVMIGRRFSGIPTCSVSSMSCGLGCRPSYPRAVTSCSIFGGWPHWLKQNFSTNDTGQKVRSKSRSSTSCVLCRNHCDPGSAREPCVLWGSEKCSARLNH
jgi:tRNA-dihydrouridine synthase B